jgi:aminoglycoside 6'-N-acetyltransferase
MPQYEFRPMSQADLPLVRRWLHVPHVAEWWTGGEEQLERIHAHIDDPTIDVFIVHAEQRPIGYLQCYDQHAWCDNGLGRHPPGTRGIDQLIGEADIVDRGHGSAFIKTFIDGVIAAGAPRVITDPDPANKRAIRAYEKAGFLPAREVNTPDGIALLMVRNA